MRKLFVNKDNLLNKMERVREKIKKTDNDKKILILAVRNLATECYADLRL